MGLTKSSGGSRPFYAYPVTRAWDTSTTWSYASGATAWSASGGDYGTPAIGTISIPSASPLLSFDLTVQLRAWQENPGGNHGIMLKTADRFNTCTSTGGGATGIQSGASTMATDCAVDQQHWYSGAYGDATKRPYLEVTWDPRLPATEKLVSPGEGDITGRRIILEGVSAAAGVSGVRFQYVAPNEPAVATRPWRDVPLTALRGSRGETLNAYPLPITGGKTPAVTWDLHTTAGMEIDGPVHVRALYTDTAGASMGVTDHVNFRLDRRDFDAADTAPIGPGQVNLLTGDLTVPATDVSIASHRVDLTLSRTYHSRGASKRTANLFGGGWESSVDLDDGSMPYRSIYNFVEYDSQDIPYDESDPEAGYETVVWQYEYAVLEDSDGTKTTFALENGAWQGEDEAGDLQLVKTGSTQFTLTDSEGNQSVFGSAAAGQPEYLITSYKEAGSPNSTTFDYGNGPDGRRRVTRVRAPVPGGVDCTTYPDSTKGCRSLVFSYVTAADGSSRLSTVKFRAPQLAQTSARTVATYGYDASWRLSQFTDAAGLVTKYTYDAQGRLGTVVPPGEQAWTLNYAPLGSETNQGRLSSASRSALGLGTATESIVYDVPVAGSGAPYDLSPATVATWAQTDRPVYASAIFPPGAAPDTTYTKAVVNYLNSRGKTVNSVAPGGAITTTEHDKFGNVVRELTAANRTRALAAGADSATTAAALRTEHSYTADGKDRIQTLEPKHSFSLDGVIVSGRRKTVTEYDAGRPAGVGPGHLPTKVTVSAQVDGQPDANARVTTHRYSDASGNRGWELGKPTATVVDEGGLTLTTSTQYHSTEPLVVATTSPGGNAGGGAANTVKFLYYASGASSGDAACDNRPEWYGQVCKRLPGAQPGTAGLPDLPVITYTYEDRNQIATQTETVGTSTRVTKRTYDAAGRRVREDITGVGKAVPISINLYDTLTGRNTRTEGWKKATDCADPKLCPEEKVSTIHRTYDELGRLTGYGNGTTVHGTRTYDIQDRLATKADAKGTQTYTYDGVTGQMTSLLDSGFGNFTADYDADGRLIRQTTPTGVNQFDVYDEAGSLVRRYYDDESNCTSNCRWLDSAVVENIHGQWVKHTGTVSSQGYGYDRAGRLTKVTDEPAGQGCTTRVYSYDADSNRRQVISEPPATGGACSTASTATPKTYAVDDADRLHGAGYSYDAFGRVTGVPAADAGGQDLAAAYFADDQASSLTQGGSMVTYDRDDPLRRVRWRASYAGVSLTGVDTNTYTDDSDNPAWEERGTDWTRYAAGIDGKLAGIERSAGVKRLQLRNAHDDVVGEASLDTAATAPTATFDANEFGVARQSGLRKYGWLGAHQRSTELPSGAMLMGVRTYLPSLGRFLQVDPVLGGSANAYEYGRQDPVNNLDLEGRETDYPLASSPCYVKIPPPSVKSRYLVRRVYVRCGKKRAQTRLERMLEGCILGLVGAQGRRSTENTVHRKTARKDAAKLIQKVNKMSSVGKITPVGAVLSCGAGAGTTVLLE
jgi:RHS repeat-associated protein